MLDDVIRNPVGTSCNHAEQNGDTDDEEEGTEVLPSLLPCAERNTFFFDETVILLGFRLPVLLFGFFIFVFFLAHICA